MAESTDRRTGLPVTATFAASATSLPAASYVSATAAARLARNLFAMPMTEFCSCTANGTPSADAASPTGMHT